MLESVVSGVLSGIVTAFFLGVAALLWQAWRTQPYVVHTNLPPPLAVPDIRLGVLHARNDDGQIVNRVHWFRPTRNGTWRATIRHPRRVGFQYKCFVDYGGSWSTCSVKAELVEGDFLEPDEGKGKPKRIWFLLPSHPMVTDPSGIRNNCFYPE